jgi:salicylate hydroxylase
MLMLCMFRADITPAPLAAYRCNIYAKTVDDLGLENLTASNGIDYWGGFKDGDRSQYFKIVLSGCRSGEILSFYLFMPQELSPQRSEGFRFEEVPVEELTIPYHDLDKRVVDLIANSFDRMPWRLYLHKEYPYWSKGKVTLTGDAAHPMLPNQSQGAVQALEDAAALGIIFSKKYGYTNDVASGLRLYEHIRKPRATRVQEASIRATEDINERIGFSSTPYSQTKHANTGVLTIDEMNLVSLLSYQDYRLILTNAAQYNMNDHIADNASDYPVAA